MIPEPFFILDDRLRVIVANTSVCELLESSKEKIEGTHLYDLGQGQWNLPDLHILLEETLLKHDFFKDYIVEQKFPVRGTRTMRLNGRRIYKNDALSAMAQPTILLAMEDVTKIRITHKKSPKTTKQTTRQLTKQRSLKK